MRGSSADARLPRPTNPAGLRRRSGAEAGGRAAGRAGGRGRSGAAEAGAGIRVTGARRGAAGYGLPRPRDACGAGPRLAAQGVRVLGQGSLRAGPATAPLA